MPDPEPTPTLKEMARRLGLNVGTISRALNGSPKVKPETRDEVLKLAEELQYRPNRSARKLVQGHRGHRFVAILMPTIPHPFFFEVLKGVVEILTPAATNLMIFNEGEDRGEVIDRILDEVPDGLLVFANQPTVGERHRIRDCRLPFLTVDCFDAEDHGVYMDNLVGGASAARYLVSRGVRRPLYIGTINQTPQQDWRLKGFTQGLAAAGITDFGIQYVGPSEEDSYTATRDSLCSGVCDGIFFFCDEMAYGGLRALSEATATVPVVGYDDMPLSRVYGLTTVRQDGHAMGREAARVILELMERRTYTPSGSDQILVRLVPELVVRNT